MCVGQMSDDTNMHIYLKMFMGSELEYDLTISLRIRLRLTTEMAALVLEYILKK